MHVDIDYHPADRYWTFQVLEMALYLAAAALLTAFGVIRIRRR